LARAFGLLLWVLRWRGPPSPNQYHGEDGGDASGQVTIWPSSLSGIARVSTAGAGDRAVAGLCWVGEARLMKPERGARGCVNRVPLAAFPWTATPRRNPLTRPLDRFQARNSNGNPTCLAGKVKIVEWKRPSLSLFALIRSGQQIPACFPCRHDTSSTAAA
jgi:hypothetical protein